MGRFKKFVCFIRRKSIFFFAFMRRAVRRFAVASILLIILMNAAVIGCSRRYIVNEPEAAPNTQVIMILGAAVYPGGGVSQVVYDRLIIGAELYKAGKASKILVSGDHGTKHYDEVNTIKAWLIKYGVPEERIVLDHAGFSTYDSVVRAKKIFKVKSLLIVTQKFHLPRAVYLARNSGIEATGVPADRVKYQKIVRNQMREGLARVKDFVFIHFLRPSPKFLGEPLPISVDPVVSE